jgi:hypothetical protein
VSEFWLLFCLSFCFTTGVLHLHCSGVTILIPKARGSAVFDEITKYIFPNLPVHNVINRFILPSSCSAEAERPVIQ